MIWTCAKIVLGYGRLTGRVDGWMVRRIAEMVWTCAEIECVASGMDCGRVWVGGWSEV